MTRWAALGAAGVLAFGRPASAVIIDGTYGAPCISPETGDEGGLIVEVHASATPPYVLFNLCEGWCYDPVRAVARIEGQHIRFDIVDRSTSSDGKIREAVTHYTGEFRGRALRISGDGEGAISATTIRLGEKTRRCGAVR